MESCILNVSSKSFLVIQYIIIIIYIIISIMNSDFLTK